MVTMYTIFHRNGRYVSGLKSQASGLRVIEVVRNLDKGWEVWPRKTWLKHIDSWLLGKDLPQGPAEFRDEVYDIVANSQDGNVFAIIEGVMNARLKNNKDLQRRLRQIRRRK